MKIIIKEKVNNYKQINYYSYYKKKKINEC